MRTGHSTVPKKGIAACDPLALTLAPRSRGLRAGCSSLTCHVATLAEIQSPRSRERLSRARKDRFGSKAAALAAFADRPLRLQLRASCCTAVNRRLGPILLQKSKVAGPRISCEKTKRKAITDSYSLNRIVEVACEFNVRR
jgi:hypothetical protein